MVSLAQTEACPSRGNPKMQLLVNQAASPRPKSFGVRGSFRADGGAAFTNHEVLKCARRQLGLSDEAAHSAARLKSEHERLSDVVFFEIGVVAKQRLSFGIRSHGRLGAENQILLYSSGKM
jgi:hypothetical protein